MSESRLTTTVGLFVVVSLFLLAVLLLSFNKGIGWLTPTYRLNLKARSVAGLQKRALVMMAGVTVGNVAGADVAPEGTHVLIRLKIREPYTIHRDARFVIEQIGFLGDQYVAIYPTTNHAPVLRPGETVTCEEPLRIQEVVRNSRDLMAKVDKTIATLNEAIDRLDQTVLSGTTLTNLHLAFNNFRVLSESTLTLANNLNRIVASNASPASITVSNLARLTANLDHLAQDVRATLNENREAVGAVLQHLRSATQSLDHLARDVEAGQGLAGALFRDETMKTNILRTAATVEMLSSNLNRFGLLYKPRKSKFRSSGILRSPRQTPP